VNRLLAGLLALSVGLVAAACDDAQGSALEVNGREVSQSSVDKELDAIADNEAFSESVEAQGGSVSDTEGTLSAQITAQWLTFLVQDEVVVEEIEGRDIEVTAENETAGQAAAEELFGAPEVFEAFPEWFRNRVVARESRRAALLAAITPEAGDGPTDEEVRAAFDQQFAEIAAQCPSGKYAAHILVETQAEADALALQLAAGADFATLAAAESIDTQSGALGGELLCFDPAQLVPEFAAAAEALPLNQVSAPVQTEFGFHLIIVRDAIPFESVEAVVREGLAADENPAGALGPLIAEADVSVNPRYGEWQVQDGEGFVQPRAPVTPSSVPEVPEVPEGSVPEVPLPE